MTALSATGFAIVVDTGTVCVGLEDECTMRGITGLFQTAMLGMYVHVT
jgi:hypothetical protein